MGLVVALAGLISDGTFFIDSGEHLAWRCGVFCSPGCFIKLFVTGTNVVNKATVGVPYLWLAQRLYVNTAAAL